jgi:hypothetical protein
LSSLNEMGVTYSCRRPIGCNEISVAAVWMPIGPYYGIITQVSADLVMDHFPVDVVAGKEIILVQ